MSSRLKKAFKELNPMVWQIFTGTCEEIDLDAGTCTVLPSNGGPPFLLVSLKSHKDATTYSVPVEGSEVVCGRLSEQWTMVLFAAEVDRVMLECDQTTLAFTPDGLEVQGKTIIRVQSSSLEVDPAGIHLESNGATLKEVMADLVNTLLALAPISAAPGSPSVPNPVDITKLNLINAKLNLLMK